MPTTYTDEFYVMDPYAPPSQGTTLTVTYMDITDQNNNGLINRYSNDNVEGSDIYAAYPGDTVTVQLGSGEIVTITGTTFYLRDGTQVFTPTDGSTLQDATFVSSTYVTAQGSTTPEQLAPTCFLAGTRIMTEVGEVAVEKLRAGDKVTDLAYGTQPLRLVLSRRIAGRELLANPKLHPVRIAAGALGCGLPKRDLWVSRQHRMLVSSAVAERMFGVRDVLVPAIKLVDLPGIEVDHTRTEITYYHLLFARHEVIYAEGAPTESLYAGAEAMKTVTPEARAEMLALFPQMTTGDSPPEPALPIPTGARQKQLVARLARNNKPPLDLPRRRVA